MTRNRVLLATVVLLSFSATRVSADDPSPTQVLREAQELARQGKYEEALQKHLWYHEHALEKDPAQTGVRLSFALMDWINLGRKYPKAMKALMEVRDRDEKAVRDGRGGVQQFDDVAAINRRLAERARTVELFKFLREKRPDLAGECYRDVEEDLVDKSEYRLCSEYLKDPLGRLAKLTDGIDVEKKRESKDKKKTPKEAQMEQIFERMFLDEINRMLKILSASGRSAEAEQVYAKAVTIFDSESNKASMKKAMKAGEGK
jgi:hypothetical protein